nr:hypothetical protein [Tanacetum cinerariifolium]
MISFCSVESPVVNISKSSTNKAFLTPKDSLDLESFLDYFRKLFTSPLSSSDQILLSMPDCTVSVPSESEIFTSSGIGTSSTGCSE